MLSYRELERYMRSKYLNRYYEEIILYLEWKRSLEHINEYWYGKVFNGFNVMWSMPRLDSGNIQKQHEVLYSI